MLEYKFKEINIPKNILELLMVYGERYHLGEDEYLRTFNVDVIEKLRNMLEESILADFEENLNAFLIHSNDPKKILSTGYLL